MTNLKLGLVGLFLSILIFAFQNCSSRFESPIELSSVSSSSSFSSSLDGKVLYSTNCASCHSDLASSVKLNRNAQQISNAINSIVQMKAIKLSATEIDAIATALSFQAPPSSMALPTLPLGGVRVAVSTASLNSPSAFSDLPMRRLTRKEISNSVRDILGVSAGALADKLPQDLVDESINPFDNDSSLQSVSSGAVESYELFAQNYSALFLTNTNAVNTLAGCTPTSSSDANCFNKFATRVGRMFLRRPVSAGELARYAVLLDRATAENNFYLATSLLIQVFVQHPEFLYRTETGQAVAGVQYRALTDYEIATRLSFLIWGSSPDSALLDAAAAGLLKSETQRSLQATRLLADVKAREQMRWFHAQWLGYSDVSLPLGLENDLKQETNKLVDQIVFDVPQDWMHIYSYNQTFLTPALAKHYGLPALTKSDWVQYSGKRGGGIFSQGQFLSQGSKFGDTSPTLRGYRILKRSLCQKFGSVPVGVDPNNPPAGLPGACKTSTYSMRHQASCVACHALTDNIGFGLENFSSSGQWRDAEPGKPSCTIDADGAVGEQLFNGPDQLGQNLAHNPVAVQCASRQLLRFTLGRASSAADQTTIEALHAQYLKTPQLNDMLLALIRSPAFINK